MRATAVGTGSVARWTTTGGNSSLETSEAVSRSTNTPASHDGGSIVDSIRSPMGRLKSGSEISGNDVVTLANGMETTVAAAVAAGFLVRDAHGGYHEAGKVRQSPQQTQVEQREQQALGQEQQQQQAQQQQAPAGEAIAALNEASEVLMDAYVSKAGNIDLAAGLGHIVAGEELPEALVARVGSQIGAEPEQVREHVATLTAAFEKQAVEAVGNPVIEWAKVNRLDALRSAATKQAMEGSLSGYELLHREYVTKLPQISPDLILNSPGAAAAGVQRGRDGTITVMHPEAGRIEWSAAIKAGLIAPHFGSRRR
jgi:hypothetical protein